MWTFSPLHGNPSWPDILLLCGEYCKPKYYQIDPTLQDVLHTSSDDPVATLESSA